MSPENPDSGAAAAEPTPRLRGLWQLMPPGPSAASESVTPPASAPTSEDVEAIDTASNETPEALEEPKQPRKSLWAVMGQFEAVAVRSEALDTTDEPLSHATANEADAVAELEIPILSVDLEARSLVNPLNESPVRRRSPAAIDRWACLCGGLSVPLSMFAYWPGLVGSLPSAGCAFAALALAFIVWTSERPTRQARWRSGTGATAALLSLALGPLVFAPWGNTARDRQTVRATQQHLDTIGLGLAAHLAEHDAYPIGGTLITLPNGQRRGGHGWMTFLLPYIDQTEVYQQINLARPYDDPENRAAMGTEVEDYYASGGDRRKVAGGFAVSHFAGVGGTITSIKGEEVPAGVFTAQRAIRPREIVDGAANTWIVGEVPGGYAPWGDPENFRTVSKGLNKDTRGFGNTAGTGAMALMADGSVRFLSNQTDVELLKRLSTRDAQDTR